MYAIEFEADIQNGIVKIPDEYRQLENRHAKIVIMVKDEHSTPQVESELDLSSTDIQSFSGRDALEVQREMRDEW